MVRQRRLGADPSDRGQQRVRHRSDERLELQQPAMEAVGAARLLPVERTSLVC